MTRKNYSTKTNIYSICLIFSCY